MRLRRAPVAAWAAVAAAAAVVVGAAGGLPFGANAVFQNASCSDRHSSTRLLGTCAHDRALAQDRCFALWHALLLPRLGADQAGADAATATWVSATPIGELEGRRRGGGGGGGGGLLPEECDRFIFGLEDVPEVSDLDDCDDNGERPDLDRDLGGADAAGGIEAGVAAGSCAAAAMSALDAETPKPAHNEPGSTSRDRAADAATGAVETVAHAGDGLEGKFSTRQKSAFSGCEATTGPKSDLEFLQKARPCGTYTPMCPDLPLVRANVDYPGGGVGAVVPDQDYIVQFDVGVHPVVARDIFKKRLKEFDSCVHCPSFEERCIEIVVTGGASWGDLGMPSSLGAKAYDCMGGCGAGCAGARLSRTHEDIGALDCLKHDVCSAWKSAATGEPTRGFCHDPDCGDEAAMTLYNCWRGWRLFGSLGGSRGGPFSEPAVCEPDTAVKGCWSHGGWFTQGRCKLFQGWERGQGIPDPHPLRSPIQRL